MPRTSCRDFSPLIPLSPEQSTPESTLSLPHLGDEVDDLVEQEPEDPDGEADEPHHEPPVPVESRRLLLQPVAVHLAVRGEVLQALVRVQNLPLLVRVLKKGGTKRDREWFNKNLLSDFFAL